MATSDYIALGSLIIAFASLAISLFKDWFTGSKQEIENSIDRHVQNKMAVAQQRMVELIETKIVEKRLAEKEAVKPRVTAKYLGRKIHFFNSGKSKAVEVSFEVTSHELNDGNSPFDKSQILQFPISIEARGTRTFICCQNSSTIRLPFTIDIHWSDENDREYINRGVEVAH